MQHSSGPFLALNNPKNRSRRLLQTRGESMGSELIRECFLSDFGPDFVFFGSVWDQGGPGAVARLPAWRSLYILKHPWLQNFSCDDQ